MRKPRHVYGKRPTAQQTLAASIFAASSSPLKAPSSPERKLRDTPERRRRQLEEPAQTFEEPEANDRVDSIAQDLEDLRLESISNSRVVTEVAHTAQSGIHSEGILGEKDSNTLTSKPHRRRRRKVISSSPEPAISGRPHAARLVEDNGSGIIRTEGGSQEATESTTRTADSSDYQYQPYYIPETPITPKERRKRLVQRKRQFSLTPAALSSPAAGTPASPTLPVDPLTTYALPLLRLCREPTITSFQTWANSLSTYFNITKIAEASYGEVYRLSLISSLCTTQTLSTTHESVLKIIALKPPPTTHPLTAQQAEKQAVQSTISSVANEVRLLRHMSPVPGFTNFRDAKVLQGRLPGPFVKAWRNYNRHVKESLFPDPGGKGIYGEEQLWAVVEMEDAGGDVEGLLERLAESSGDATGGSRTNAAGISGITPAAVWDIFWSVALAVAKGEEYAAFEHRDLHIGNICVKPSAALVTNAPTPRSTAETCLKLVTAPIERTTSTDDTAIGLGTTGLETTIIDYTLSRASVPSSSTTAATAVTTSHSSPTARWAEDEETAFFDLSSDAAIFEGDAEEEYQYEIYRYMRATVLCGDPAAVVRPHREQQEQQERNPQQGRRGRRKKDEKAASNGTGKEEADVERAQSETEAWRASCKMTNLVWLHFVLFKLVEAMAPASPTAASRPHRQRGKRSADTWTGAVSEGETTLRARLRKLSRLLGIEQMAKGPCKSAAELVGWAVEEGWLSEEDVVGHGGPSGIEDESRISL